MPAARQHARVPRLRGQLVAHRIVLRRAHVHRLPGVRVAGRRVVLLHRVRRRRQWRAHVLLWVLLGVLGMLGVLWVLRVLVLMLMLRVLLLRRRLVLLLLRLLLLLLLLLLLAVLHLAYRRQVQRGQRHVRAWRRPSVGLPAWLPRWRVRVGGLHRGGRWVRVRRGIGAGRRRRLLLLLLLLLLRLLLLLLRLRLSRLLLGQVGHARLRKVRRGGRVGRWVGRGGHSGKIVRHGQAMGDATRGARLPFLCLFLGWDDSLGTEGARSRSSLESLRVAWVGRQQRSLRGTRTAEARINSRGVGRSTQMGQLASRDVPRF